MGEIFSTLDLVLFFTALIGVMAVGLIAGRKEDTSEDYFLAGRKIPWWGVAGSIFGSNVSANHMVGMMGIGFSIGFAQSHFELGAIFGLMVLCYIFLPVYRKLNVYTLSEYLGRRYDERSRLAYSVIMIIIMAVVQMVPGLYIGSRTICVLLGGDAVEQVEVPVKEKDTDKSTATAVKTKLKTNVKMSYYALFVLALAAISAAYTIFGGLKAVIWTDVMQSVLLLVAGILIAILTFNRIGGWQAMMALDASGARKMHMYLPSNHPDLPWTGVFTGLMAMHCFYWGTNQFIVQRALGARSDREARLGIVTAGFLKLVIPFFAIGTGVAAFYLFQQEVTDRTISPDAAFPELVKLVIPLGYGIIGLISAGLIGAILSSIDSMMNSAATLVTMDIYQRHINPDATDKQLIRAGRISIVGFVIVAALMAIFVLNPNSDSNFFLIIVDYQNYLTPGLLVAFFMGILWKRGTPNAGFITIVTGIIASWLVIYVYNNVLVDIDIVRETFGTQLNFFHRVVAVIFISAVVYVVVSLCSTPDAEKSKLCWSELGSHAPGALKNLLTAFGISIAFFAVLGFAMVQGWVFPTAASLIAGLWTLGIFLRTLLRSRASSAITDEVPTTLISDDRFWAGILCAIAVAMHYYFY